MSWPEEVRDELENYVIMRLESYYLSQKQWRRVAERQYREVGKGYIAASTNPNCDIAVISVVVLDDNGDIRFVVVPYEYGKPVFSKLESFGTAAEAMKMHEELARPIRDRMDAIRNHEGHGSLKNGAL